MFAQSSDRGPPACLSAVPIPTPDQYAALLRAAANLVRHGWNKHSSAVDANGTSCGYYSDRAVSFCTIGAIYRVVFDAMGGDREIVVNPEFRLAVNRLTRYLALTIPHIVPIEISLSHDADDPHYGIEARLGAWNDNVARRRSVVRALEAAADLAEYDAHANPGHRLTDYAGHQRFNALDTGESIFNLTVFESGIRSGACPLRAIEDILYMSSPSGRREVNPRSEPAHHQAAQEQDIERKDESHA